MPGLSAMNTGRTLAGDHQTTYSGSSAMRRGEADHLIGLAAFAAHLVRQIVRLDIDDPDLCLALFRSNRDAGFLFFAGLVADGLRHFF